MMGPAEFLLWLNGASEVVGEEPPTPEQWAVMRAKIEEAVGTMVAHRLLADSTSKEQAERLKSRLETYRKHGNPFGLLGTPLSDPEF